jgi:hypothetical protein
MASKSIKTLSGLLLTGLVLVLAVRVLTPREAPASRLPSPNGNDDFVQAGKALVGTRPDVKTATLEELRSFVSQNTNALSLVRLGLSRKCQVPVEFTMNYANRRLPELASIKQLANALAAEGKLAELEQRTNDALMACIDTIRLGHESVRGGVMIDKLVGVACEGIGLNRLESLAPGLGEQECRQTARALEQVDQQGESLEQVLRMERTWSGHSTGLAGRIVKLIQSGSMRAAEQKFSQRFQQRELQRRRLMLQLAVRACEAERGKKPDSASLLVPQYLSSIPVDPFTRTNLSLTQPESLIHGSQTD